MNEKPIVVELFDMMRELAERPDFPVTHEELVGVIHTLMVFVDKSRKGDGGKLELTLNLTDIKASVDEGAVKAAEKQAKSKAKDAKSKS